jgi:hypothetical protein
MLYYLDTYRNRIKLLIQYFEDHCTEQEKSLVLKDGKLLLPIPDDKATIQCYTNFWTYLCANGYSRSKLTSPSELDPEKHPDPYSVSSIEGYRSALLYEHSTYSPPLALNPSLNFKILKLITGYKSVVNGLRKRGLMKAHEGKS